MITAKLIWSTILRLSDDWIDIDVWEIWSILWKDLKWSWKKPQLRPVDSMRADVVLNRKVFKAFMWAAIKKGARLIFIDESFFNPRHLRYKSWVSTTHFTPVTMHSSGFGVAAICALTDEGLMYTVLRKGTNSTWEILLFFLDLEK